MYLLTICHALVLLSIKLYTVVEYLVNQAKMCYIYSCCRI